LFGFLASVQDFQLNFASIDGSSSSFQMPAGKPEKELTLVDLLLTRHFFFLKKKDFHLNNFQQVKF
jgi:hypothetical protein